MFEQALKNDGAEMPPKVRDNMKIQALVARGQQSALERAEETQAGKDKPKER